MRRVHGTERLRKLQNVVLEDRRKRFETGEYGYIAMPAHPAGPDAELATWPLDEVKTVFGELQRT